MSRKNVFLSLLLSAAILLAVVVIAGFIMAATAKRPTDIGIQANGQLAECPSSPNAVSSDAPHGTAHHIEPLAIYGTPAKAWQVLMDHLAQQGRVTIVSQNDHYLHAEYRSAFFGFVDDLECHLRPEAGHIAVRSASRSGYSDLGVNRQRVEALRQVMQPETP